MNLKLFIVLFVQLYSIQSFGQKNDDNNKIFFISEIEFQNLVLGYPLGNNNCREGRFFTEKENLLAMDKENNLNKEFLIFNPGCYEVIFEHKQITEFIIPNIDNDSISKYLQLNNKKYMAFCCSPDLNISSHFIIENFKYYEVLKQKYLILLIPLKLYNQMFDVYTEKNCFLFKDEPSISGLYIKVIIPICD